MKKLSLFFLTLFVLMGCNQTPPKIATDQRPATEQGLIAQLNRADSIYQDQTNEISKKEVLYSMTSKVDNYILKQLDTKTENWQAKVLKIDVGKGLDYTIDVQLSIPLHFDGDEKDAEYNAIILTSIVGFDDQSVKEALKTLKPNDKVYVSGNFQKNKFGEIDFTGLNLDERYSFNQPEFAFEIKSIKKIAQ